MMPPSLTTIVTAQSGAHPVPTSTLPLNVTPELTYTKTSVATAVSPAASAAV